jgi:hypothetical protein
VVLCAITCWHRDRTAVWVWRGVLWSLLLTPPAMCIIYTFFVAARFFVIYISTANTRHSDIMSSVYMHTVIRKCGVKYTRPNSKYVILESKFVVSLSARPTRLPQVSRCKFYHSVTETVCNPAPARTYEACVSCLVFAAATVLL